MANFKIMLRKQESIKDKPKVFFACHYDNFEYLHPIAEDILDRQDCAFIFDSELDDNTDYEELKIMLSQVNMIVFPITKLFLNDECVARSFVVKYALENHIPLLPIMCEKNIDRDFNKIIGDIQFLNKYSTDSTEISYDKKLNDFLSSVLVSKETKEEVKSAFSCYIFLSYRKKDRKYAQQLMNVIHSNKEFRDVAIWYDEFLTPGDNFNEEILSALLKSDLFALAVTPNLINENNYVMEHEYPIAKKEDKTIFPVELLETDQNILKEKYLDIPDCVKIENNLELSKSLLDILSSSLQTQNNSPDHIYLIGLAYLNGIDVEINRKLALELITESANKGYILAIEKLIQMYRYGIGVEINLQKELYWMEIYLKSFKENFLDIALGIKEEIGENAYLTLVNPYYNNLFRYCYLNIDLLNNEHIKKTCNEAIVELDIIEDKSSALYKELLSMIYMLLYRVEKDAKLANEYLSKSNELLNSNEDKLSSLITQINILSNSIDENFDLSILDKNLKALSDLIDNDNIFVLANTYYNVAVSLKNAIHYDIAKKYFDIAIQIFEKIYSNQKSLFGCEVYPFTYIELRDIFELENNTSKANECNNKALEIMNLSLNEALEDQDYIKASNLYLGIANIYSNLQNSSKVEETMLEGLNMLESLDIQNNELYATKYVTFAMTLANRYKGEQNDLAKSLYSKALNALSTIMETQVETYATNIISILNNWLLISYEEQDFETLEMLFNSIISIYNTYKEEYPTSVITLETITSLSTYAVYQLAFKNDFQKSELYALHALNTLFYMQDNICDVKENIFEVSNILIHLYKMTNQEEKIQPLLDRISVFQ